MGGEVAAKRGEMQAQSLFGSTGKFCKVDLPAALCFGVSFITGTEARDREIS